MEIKTLQEDWPNWTDLDRLSVANTHFEKMCESLAVAKDLLYSIPQETLEWLTPHQVFLLGKLRSKIDQTEEIPID